ncbi:MAG: hypothetical protein A4E53_04528 [Pelotomaculum sp. PtaB.Bin104]|nr:MAG: hypothetical protein A4E53_04528 [Pelotomaculum sp. PtaB.Bin104]
MWSFIGSSFRHSPENVVGGSHNGRDGQRVVVAISTWVGAVSEFLRISFHLDAVVPVREMEVLPTVW